MIAPIRFDILQTFDILKYADPAMTAIFWIWMVVFILLGIVLSYHWREYGYNILAAWLFTAIYFSVGIGLLAGMFIAKTIL